MSKILLTPGPCMTSDTVRAAAAMPDLNHREPEYLSLIRETKERLLNVYPETSRGWRSYLLGGSGTLAVEAMLTSCIGAGTVLVLENGYYSERIADVLEAQQIPFERLRHGWLDPWDFDRIEAAIKSGRFEAAVGTHNETTTGRLNDISRLGKLCQQHGVRCLIDAMSSFGADPIDFENLDAVCSSANKCLHGIPGVGFVLVRKEFAQEMSGFPVRSYYMRLGRYEGDDPPLTPPVPALAAFRQALRELPQEGAVGRGKDYAQKLAYLRTALAEFGSHPAIPFNEASCTLAMLRIPSGFTFDEWFEANYREGYVIYGCKGDLRDLYFQASVMGEVTVEQLRQWVSAMPAISYRWDQAL